METKVICPHCGQSLAVDSAAIGHSTTCPNCSAGFIVPAVARIDSPNLSDQQTGGLAVTSMILGLISIPCLGFITGIPAIILGHIAYSRAKKSPAQFGGGNLAIAGLIMGYVSSLLTLTAVVLFLLNKSLIPGSGNSTYAIESENHLKEIGQAFIIWEGDHHGQFPFNVSQADGGTRELCHPDANGIEQNPVPTFAAMSDSFYNPQILYCPNDPARQIATTYSFAALTTNNISYLLRTGPDIDQHHPREILMIDPINGLVLHCDGSVDHDPKYQKADTNN